MNHAIDLMSPAELERLPRDADAGFGALATARGHLPLEAMEVHARAVGLDVQIELRQTFANALAEPIEATYIFPLPDRAAVTRFRLRVGERVTEGVIQERGQARAAYDDAIRAGHRAAIAEEERPDVFTVRVGNILPGQRAEVTIDLVGALSVDRNEATFRFPLVVAPRYVPGMPLPGASVGEGVVSDTDAVPDASRITPPVLLPGYPNPVRLGLTVDVDPAGLPLSQLRSSLHAVIESSGAGGRRTIRLARAERLDRDFVLRYALGDGAIRTSLRVAPDPTGVPPDAHESGSRQGVRWRDQGPDAGHGGSFVLTVMPPDLGAAGQTSRDVVVVLDRSGSMEGWKMIAARRAAARIIDSLGSSDRFAVLAFDDRIDAPAALPADALVEATDRSRFRAVEFLATLEARGGTEMAAPLLRAAELLGSGYRDRDRILVLVTDGQIGNEDQILRALAPRLHGRRVFALGVDRAVNAGFLRRLADLGSGASELVESEDRLDEVMDRVHRQIGAPVVTELSLEGVDLDLDRDSIAPRRLPDLLAGAPVVVRGRVRRLGGRAAVRLRGVDASGRPWEETVPAASGGGSEVAALWARAIIRDLEDRYAVGDPDPNGLMRRIIDVSIGCSVLSRFTAFLAVDRSERVNPGGQPHKVVQAVEPASGWDMLEQEKKMQPVARSRARSAPPPAMQAMGRVARPMAMGPSPGAPAPRADKAKKEGRGGGAARRYAAPAPEPAQAPRSMPAAPPLDESSAEAFDATRASSTAPIERAQWDLDDAEAGAPAPVAEEASARVVAPVGSAPMSLLEWARKLLEVVTNRGGPDELIADMIARELDAQAGRVLAAGRGGGFVRLERARHALRSVIQRRAVHAELDRILAEIEAALREVIAHLEASGPAPGPARREFWK